MSEQSEPESSDVTLNPPRQWRRLLVWMLTAFVWIVVAVLDIEFGIGFLAWFSLLLMFVLFLAVVAGIIGLVIALRRDNWEMLKWASIVVVLWVMEFVAVGFVSHHQRELTIGAGGRILAAAEAYRATNGAYPDDLDELVPQYLREIPNSKMGWGVRPFRYRRITRPDAEEGFTLSFDRHGSVWTSYSSESGSWYDRD